MHATGEFGDVKLWSKCELSSYWNADAQLHTREKALFNLRVLGHPKTIAAEMLLESAFDRGLFEAPISMTLAYGFNWVHQWNSDLRSEKANLLDQLCEMKESAMRCLSYDRYHFSTTPIEALLSMIDDAVTSKDRLAFIENTAHLNELEAMRFIPQSD